MATRRERPAVQAAMERTGITRELSQRLMRVIDKATVDTLKTEGLEAFRFDGRLCPEEGWVSVTIKMRPVGRK